MYVHMAECVVAWGRRAWRAGVIDSVRLRVPDPPCNKLASMFPFAMRKAGKIQQLVTCDQTICSVRRGGALLPTIFGNLLTADRFMVQDWFL